MEEDRSQTCPMCRQEYHHAQHLHTRRGSFITWHFETLWAKAYKIPFEVTVELLGRRGQAGVEEEFLSRP